MARTVTKRSPVQTRSRTRWVSNAINAFNTGAKIGRAVRTAYKRYSSRTQTKGKQKASSGKWGGATGYIGRFRKPNRKTAVRDSLYLKNGAHLAQEVAGTFSDAECAFVGCSSSPAFQTLKVVCMGICRKMFESGSRQSITNPMSIISGSNGMTVRFRAKEGSTGVISNSMVYANALGFSLEELATQFTTILISNRVMSISLRPFSLDYYTTTNVVPHAFLDLSNLDVFIKTSTTLKVQNRTATVEGEDAEDVDNQPIKGYLYTGSGMQPRNNVDVAVAFDCNTVNGMILKSGSSTNSTQDPPHPGTFKSAKAVAVYVNPGQVKITRFFVEKKIDFWKFVTQITPEALIGNQSYVQSFGQWRMLALEKIIDVGTNPILVAYEAEYDLKSYCCPRSKPYITKYNVF